MKITIKQNDKQHLFRAYVELLQPILKIRNREADVYAHLLYLNDSKKAIPEEDRFEIIFSTKSRKNILNALGIKDGTLHNCLSELRRKKLVTKQNTIPTQHQVYCNDDDSLDVVYKIKVNV